MFTQAYSLRRTPRRHMVRIIRLLALAGVGLQWASFLSDPEVAKP
jgi:hypothetical protein